MQKFEKIKVFFYITLTALVIGGFSMQGGNMENYERAIWVGSFVFSFCYGYIFSGEVHKIEAKDTIGSHIVKAMGLLFFVMLMTIFLDMTIRYVTRFDACEGWAESEKYCKIQLIQEEYRIDNSYEDY